MATAAAYGSWRSPITAAAIAAGEVSLSSPDIANDDVYWLEGKPLEGGRIVVVRVGRNGSRQELTPAPFNVRTRVHEYGGGSYLIHHSSVFFSNFADQRLYRLDAGQAPRAITPVPAFPAGLRYADACVSDARGLLICVRERHETDGREATNELVAVAADGSGQARIIASGHDFYSSPRLSPDGRYLAWLSWDHPRMPWDGTELW
ncbi:MAG TPA: S9 family peptidase, partial [Chloroflexota bacterium]